ncbi:unnamed protein product [Vicia faba]|uniref:Uncharacterized protein n=1 Tax=Vicia faba TaxID=3906 RepID=A0AAV1AJZ8_VICFA|nr:unnamed protein product [Vicia faba]
MAVFLLKFFVEVRKKISSSFSSWWRDIIKVGSFSNIDPIASNSRFIIRSVFSTPFWEVKWLEDKTLKEDFSDLFVNSFLKRVSVAGMGGWSDGIWIWGDLDLSAVVDHDPVLLPDYVSLKERLEDFVGMSCNAL